MIPDDVVERVRAEADIVQIIGEFVRLKRVGTGFRGPCPFHQGKHDNFSVSPRGGYVCFVCGEKGDVFTFVEKRLGLDFVEAVKWVGAKVGVDVREVRGRSRGTDDEPDPRTPFWEVNAAAAEYFQRELQEAAEGQTARDYLSSRAVSLGDAARFGIGYAPANREALREHLHSLGFPDDRLLAAGLLIERSAPGSEQGAPADARGGGGGGSEPGEVRPRPRFRHRLMFPIYDAQDRVVGFGGRILGRGEPKYLNSAESPVFSKRKLLYGLNWAKAHARTSDRLILVEGYFDAIRLWLSGIGEVVAPLGTALTTDQCALIKRHTRNVYLLYDSDPAGQRATFRSGDELLRHAMAVRVMTLPDGEDPDSYAAVSGASGIERAIHDSVDIFDRKVQILQRSGWFADLRRKREALDKLLPTIRAAADPLCRDLYVTRAADVAGISREVLERELGSQGGAPRPPGPAERTAAAGGRHDYQTRGLRAERELVRAILHQPALLRVTAELDPGLLRDRRYRALFVRLRSIPASASLNVDELADSLDEAATALLEELLADAGGLDRGEELVAGSVNALLAREIDAQMMEIDRALPTAPPDEKDDLILEKRRLHRKMQALGGSRWPKFRKSWGGGVAGGGGGAGEAGGAAGVDAGAELGEGRRS